MEFSSSNYSVADPDPPDPYHFPGSGSVSNDTDPQHNFRDAPDIRIQQPDQNSPSLIDCYVNTVCVSLFAMFREKQDCFAPR